MAAFWESKPLTKMTSEEWESLCDGCGKCCLIKLEDIDTGELRYTNVACRLFDDETCRCVDYERRKSLVSGCVILSPKNLDEVAPWMPATCAYKRLYEGDPLPEWHPLIAGSTDKMHAENHSMLNRTIPEYDVAEDELEDHMIEGMI